jgi:apolipoprotein D and lipocalin family protein
MKKLLLLLAALLPGCFGGEYPPLATVETVDVPRYLGKWYEVARLPNRFQKGCSCASAEYSMIDNETIRVVNRCRDGEGGERSISGKAFVVEGSNNAKLRVQFFWPFRGDYWIIELDRDAYQWVVVGEPSREYLWILSRTRPMAEDTFRMLVERARAKGFDVAKLVRSGQECIDGDGAKK